MWKGGYWLLSISSCVLIRSHSLLNPAALSVSVALGAIWLLALPLYLSLYFPPEVGKHGKPLLINVKIM